MTAYVKIRQILCAFEEGKVTKKTKTGGYYLYEKEKVGTGCHDSCNSFSDAWNKSRSDKPMDERCRSFTVFAQVDGFISISFCVLLEYPTLYLACFHMLDVGMDYPVAASYFASIGNFI